jgi:hypothetical protein
MTQHAFVIKWNDRHSHSHVLVNIDLQETLEDGSNMHVLNNVESYMVCRLAHIDDFQGSY